MSTWTNEFDVFRDLDILSGLKRSNVTYPARNAFGRGTVVVKEDRNGRRTTVAQFPPPPKIPAAQSYPEAEVASNVQNDTTWERDRDLYLQLREVCGRGYSNELIEEEFGQTEWHSQEQFNDVSCDPVVEDLLEEERNKLIISDPEHTTLTLNKSTSSQSASNEELSLPDVKHARAKLFVHPPKLKPSRNALLNSLARRKILQLSEEPEMTGSPVTCCIAEDVISNDKSPPGAKLLGAECVNGHLNSAIGDKLPTPSVDSKKTVVESLEISDQEESYEESQKQCINWSDIRKLKVSGYSPVSMYFEGSSSSPVHSVNSCTSKMSRQDSKVKSVAATSSLEMPASPNFLCEERGTSEWKQDNQKKQDLSPQAFGVQSKSRTKRTKEYRCSLPSSPTNSVTRTEKLSWSSLRSFNSHPKNIMLSDYIEPSTLRSVPTQNFSEVSYPCPEELRNCNSLQIRSVKDFPPLE